MRLELSLEAEPSTPRPIDTPAASSSRADDETDSTIPPTLKLKVFGDQSLFVRSAIEEVVRETLIAAVLTGTIILLFLGSWRSTLIVAVSIPLAILS